MAERILIEAGGRPYGPHEWQLVQTHLILPSGELLELWRPGQNTGSDDPKALLAALQKAVADLKLSQGSALPSYESPRLGRTEPGGALLETVLRFPLQKSFPRDHAFTIDWVSLSPNDVSLFLPPDDSSFPIALPAELASRMMIHLRPPLDDAKDPEEKAMALVKSASLQLMDRSEDSGVTTVGLGGELTLLRDPKLPAAVDDEGKWSEIVSNNIYINGFARFNDESELLDFQLVTRDTHFMPPNLADIYYNGMMRMVRE